MFYGESFRDNRDLLHDLPSIGARVISRWVHLRYGAMLDIDVIQHTFGRHLNFNCHLHVLVSGFGLRRSESRFVPVRLDADEIMSWWRDAITLYLQEIAKLGQLQSALSIDALTAGVISQGRRKWSVHIARFKSKEQLLHYAGRYVRRPPNRATSISDGHGRARGILDKRPQIEASRENPIPNRRLRQNARGSHSRSLPTCGPQLRTASATIYRADAKRPISAFRTEAA
jgi:Putative transposase